MQTTPHTVTDYTDAQRALLPPGAAFNWPQGGFGDALLGGMSAELARVDEEARLLLSKAITNHQIINANWHIDEYRRVADEALAGVVEVMPRTVATVDGAIGDRLWVSGLPMDFTIQLVEIADHLGPAAIGRQIGDYLWGQDGRFVMRVRYYKSVVDPQVLWAALDNFRQAHVFFLFEDITGSGGYFGQN
jgi:hypothetical protein